MHKYQPRIHLLRNPRTEDFESELDNAETFVFPETAFMAVTSYQNHLVSLPSLLDYSRRLVNSICCVNGIRQGISLEFTNGWLSLGSQGQDE